MLSENSPIQWISTNSGLPVPSINGLRLCSSRYPIIEAKNWCTRYAGGLSGTELICAVGLGAGYQIIELACLYPDSKFIVFEKSAELIWGFEKGNTYGSRIHLCRPLKSIDIKSSDSRDRDVFKSICELSAPVLIFSPAIQHWAEEAKVLHENLLGSTVAGLVPRLDHCDIHSTGAYLSQYPGTVVERSHKSLAGFRDAAVDEEEQAIWGVLGELIR